MTDPIEDLVPEIPDDDETPKPPAAAYGLNGFGDVAVAGASAGVDGVEIAAAGAGLAGDVLGAGAEAAGEVAGAGAEVVGALAGGLDGCSGCSCVLVIAAGLLLSAGSALAVHFIR